MLYMSIVRSPYHFYKAAIQEGIESPFLSLRKLPEQFYSGQTYDLAKMPGITEDEARLWENLHFNDFMIPFPIRHPSFWVTPYIESFGGESFFGFQILNYNLDVINQVVFKKRERFKLDLYRHKIFHLPMFERKITKMGLEAVWKDVFRENIYLSPYLESPGYFDVFIPTQLPLAEMAYDLFILSVRERFFPIKTRGLYYWEKRKLGIIEIMDDETIQDKAKRFHQEVVYYLQGDQIYTIEIKTLIEDLSAEKYRQKLLKDITFKKSEPDSSIPLYATFQNLPYQTKLTPTGLTYLFAAFSHQKKSEDFLRQSIRFMERGKNNRVYLDPLYKYGYDLYGTSFSKMLNKIQETQDEKLKRKKEEELQAERDKLRDIDILDEAEKFETEEEKIRFYLQKAKDTETKEKDPKSLIID